MLLRLYKQRKRRYILFRGGVVAKMISIIVPVYKTEDYIEECIRSILQQTYKEFELILVDDGSPDRSGQICDKYAKNDSRIKVIHKENQGVSAARNNGLDLASGEYVCFIDSDDYVDKDYIRILAEGITQGGLSSCKMNVTGEAILSDHKDYLQPDQAQISCLSANGMGGVIAGKLYDLSIINANSLRFEQDISICEDLLFAVQYLKYATGYVVWNHSSLYYYRPNQEGAVKRRFRQHSNYSESELSEIIALERCYNYLYPHDQVKMAWKSRMVKAAVNTIRVMEANQIKDVDREKCLLKLIRKNVILCMRSKYLAFSSKISILLCSVSPVLEHMIRNMY